MTEDTAAAVSETDPSDPLTPQRPVETSTLQDSSGSSRQTRPRLKAWPLSLEAELYTPIHCSNCKGWLLTVGGFLDHMLGPGGAGTSCFIAIHDPMPRCEMPWFVYRNLCKKWGFTKKMDEYITAELTPFLAKRIPEWKEWRRQDDLEIAAAEALAQKEAEERAEARRARIREERRKRRLEYKAKRKSTDIHSSGWSNEAIAKRRKVLIDRSQKSAELSKKILKKMESRSSFKQDRVTCSICGGVLSKDSLRKHLAVVHPAEWEPGSQPRSQPNSVEIKVPKSECPICETSVRRYDLKSHIQENHPEDFSQERWDAGEEKRKKEKAWIRQMILLDTFGYELPSGRRIYCPVCDKSWSGNRPSSLKDHLQRVHPDDFSQELWDEGLQKRKLIAHSSLEVPMSNCPVCEESVRRFDLKSHIQDSHPEDFSQEKWDEGEDKRKAEKAECRSKKDQEVVKQRGAQEFKGKRIYCPVCDRSFSSSVSQRLKDHINNEHPDDFSQEKWDNGLKKRKLTTEAQTTGCLICGLTLSSPENLKRHIKSMHSSMEVPMSSCPICEESVRRFDLKSHIQDSHPEDFSQEKWDEGEGKRKAIKAENRSKVDQEALKQCGKLQFKGRRIYCPICDKACNRRQRLKDHIFKEHPDDFCQELWDKGHSTGCSVCGLTLSSLGNLKRHIKSMHSKMEVPMSSCPICEESVRRCDLKSHIQDSHPEDFSQGKWDEGEDKRKAEKAKNRSKKDQEALKQQGAQEFKGKRIYCPICDKGCNKPQRLKDHICKEHPDDFCQELWDKGHSRPEERKTTNGRASRSNNEKSCESPKSDCPICKLSVSRTHLKQHLQRKHPEDFSQELWDKGLQKRKLKHIQNRSTLNNNKPPKGARTDCPICKLPVSSRHLKDHLKRIHPDDFNEEKWNNGIKKRKLETRDWLPKTGCSVCGAMISSSNLSRHIKSRHSGERISSTTTSTSGGRGVVGLKKDSSNTSQVDFCLKCHAETTDLAKHVKRAHKNEMRLEKLPFLKRNLRIASKYKSI